MLVSLGKKFLKLWVLGNPQGSLLSFSLNSNEEKQKVNVLMNNQAMVMNAY